MLRSTEIQPFCFKILDKFGSVSLSNYSNVFDSDTGDGVVVVV